MRFSLLLVTAFLLITATSALAAPKLVVPEPGFSFGSIVQGDKVNHVFPIANNGDSPLNIQRLSASCGCTAANASAPAIQPGKRGEIRVTFDSANFTGKVTKNVVIESNDPKTPSYTLTLTGNITEEIQVNPRQLNLGQLKAGVPATSTITLTNKGNRILRVLSAKAQIPQIMAEIKNSQLKEGESAVIEVIVTPKTTDRILSGYLTIVTDSPRKSEIVVPVYGSPAK